MIEIDDSALKRKNLLKLNISFKKIKIKLNEYLMMSFNDDDTSVKIKEKIKKIQYVALFDFNNFFYIIE